ncbi:hypothetical protein PICMEDRAFT_15658 [Pichia membranifaciens NRRL Y-2026]|uniref:NADH:flavin oxidoreductase/NADH oxidase N-terminal domain-containing protein n=1 Tax=Pichia membranifaciens NRRL Y-2026 TaxID=763406 RepID=A0A1E3NNV1_9ASCO|nr:hypothetical protein PICMEDRAFT_15658 [Pichia membranifaciens NRRL Y-2026]ODQ47752.1 hypothetical protein PICMEDRAFT_15658 [Pichia membranifaciens NRRL Y-2026]
MSSLATSNLFKPIQVGDVILKTRLAHAPTTRIRASKDGVATDSMLEYYSERAKNNGGLIVFEGTSPRRDFGCITNQPILETKQQVEAQKKIVDAIHSNGSYVTSQLAHYGRVLSPQLAKLFNIPFVGPSAIYLDEASEKAAKEEGVELKELSKDEIKNIVKEFANGAKRAINEAGFDFVEVHGAYMYLLDQFIQTSANQRTDEYGGSIENRARLLLEVIDACIEAVGAKHVAVRLSPYMEYQGGLGKDSEINPIVIWGYILSELQNRADKGNELAYISIVEPRAQADKEADETYFKIDFSWPRLLWKGVLLRTGAFLDLENQEKFERSINGDDKLLIGVSRYYTSNPDLANRLKEGFPLTPYDRNTLYKAFSNDGYLNFQAYGKEQDHTKDDVEPKPLA